MNLEKLNVQEMNTNEMKETEGGWYQFVIGALIGGLIYDLAKVAITEGNGRYGEWMWNNGSNGGAK